MWQMEQLFTKLHQASRYHKRGFRYLDNACHVHALGSSLDGMGDDQDLAFTQNMGLIPAVLKLLIHYYGPCYRGLP